MAASTLVELGLAFDEAMIGGGQRAFGRGIEEQAVHEADELVAGGAGDRQILAQVLVAGEDLLDQQVDRPAAARIDLGAFAIPAFGEHVGDARQQPLTVAPRVVHAVDVIEAHALHLASAIRRSSRRWVASNTSPCSMRRPASWLMSKKRR